MFADMIIKVFVLVGFLCMADFNAFAVTTDKLSGDTAATSEDWGNDIDKKIDTTISVLKVLKEELKEVKREEDKTALEKKAESEDEFSGVRDWSAGVRKAIDRAKGVMTKLKKAGVTETDNLVSPDDEKDMEAIKKDVSAKLDKTIEAMKVIKEELDKKEEK